MKRFFTVAVFMSFISVSFAQIGIGTTSPNSTLDVRGSISGNYRAFTSSTTGGSDYTLVFTGTSAATLTLPDASAITGRVYWIKNASSNASTLTIATTSSQTIDGAASWSISQTNKVITLVSNGANWYTVGESVPGNTTGSAWVQGGNNVSSQQNIGTTSNYGLPIITNSTERMYISNTGNVGIGSSSFDGTAPEKLLIDAGTTSSYNLIGAYGDRSGYLQLNIQNTNSGGTSSTDIVATADNGTELTNYVDLGINSSGYNNGSGLLNGANNCYLYSKGQDFVIGNASTSKSMIFFTGGDAASNERIRILGTGNIGVNSTAPNSTFEVNGSVGNAITTTTGNITLGASHYTLIITGGTPTITLPAAASGNARRIYIIVNETLLPVSISTYKSFSGSNTTTIAGNSSITIQSDGSNWYRIQ